MFDELIEQWGGRRAFVAALGNQHMHGRVPIPAARSMITWDGIADVLLWQRLAPPLMRVVHTAGRTINPANYLDRDSTPRRTDNPVVNIGKLGAILDAGSTLVIDSIDEMLPNIGATALELSDLVGEWVQAHLYATKGATPAFAPHWDVIDVLVVMVEGEKHWDVYGPGNIDPIDATIDPDNRRRKSSRPPPATRVMRSSTVSNSSDWAPWSDVDPTSSWSNSASTGTHPRGSAASNASRPA